MNVTGIISEYCARSSVDCVMSRSSKWDAEVGGYALDDCPCLVAQVAARPREQRNPVVSRTHRASLPPGCAEVRPKSRR